MKSLFAALVRSIGLAIVSILLSIELTISYPVPMATFSIAQIPQPIVTPLPPTPIVKQNPPNSPATNQNPPAQPAPKQAQAKSGGPYDLKAIQESYKSLYGS
jgi:hypothetical protein